MTVTGCWLNGIEWQMSCYNFEEFEATLQCSVAVKLMDYIRQHTYVLCGGRGTFTKRHSYYAHCDGQNVCFKYGKWDDLR